MRPSGKSPRRMLACVGIEEAPLLTSAATAASPSWPLPPASRRSPAEACSRLLPRPMPPSY